MGRFRYFVIFAEMRTGSNLLETALNDIDGITCLGELFNPHFIGGPNREPPYGFSMEDRARDPEALLAAVIGGTRGLPGFRLFHDHDPRMIDRTIRDPDCAKIILTRNPVDAFVSRKIAGATGQWRLGDLKDRKTAEIDFDIAEFEAYLSERQAFQSDLRRRLQLAGQPALHVTYEDIQSVETVNGVAAYLGADARLDRMPADIKKQNPGRMRDKVRNFDRMQRDLAGFDWIDLDRAPFFEPERGPGVPGFLAIDRPPLLFMPVAGGPTAAVADRMRELGGGRLAQGFVQKTLRAWLRDHPTHQSFTVLRHPLARAWDAFQRQILPDGTDHRAAVRKLLETRYGVTLSGQGDPEAAFHGFLRFLEGTLAGQTPMRADPAWSSQAAVLEGFARFRPPDRILREADLAEGLAAMTGRPARPLPGPGVPGAVASGRVTALIRRVYRRDFDLFGFDEGPSGSL